MNTRDLARLVIMTGAVALFVGLGTGCSQPLSMRPFDGSTYYSAVELVLASEPEEGGEAVFEEIPRRNGPQLRESDEVTITAVANEGWQFLRWSGVSDLSENPVSLTLAADGTLTAHFIKAFHPVSLYPGEGGAIATEPKTIGEEVEHGTSIRLSPRANDGYAFAGWENAVSGADLGSDSPLELTVTGPLSVRAIFSILKHPLTTRVAGGGRVDVTSDAATDDSAVPHGTVVTLSAVPNNGYRFSHWTGDADGSHNPATVQMDAARSVTAVFARSTYRVTTFTAGEGSVSHTLLDGPDLVHGGRVRFDATAAEGWRFVEWRGPSLAARAADTAADGPHGTTVGGASESGPAGTGASSGAAAAAGAPADSSQGGASESVPAGSVPVRENPLVLTATGDIELTAVFERKPRIVTVAAVGGGSASAVVIVDSAGAAIPGGSGDPGDFVDGARIRLSAAADDGWVFTHWEGDITGALNPKEHVLSGNLYVAAVFARSTYRVATSTAGEGSVSHTLLDGPDLVHGGRVRFEATASEGWRFVEWRGPSLAARAANTAADGPHGATPGGAGAGGPAGTGASSGAAAAAGASADSSQGGASESGPAGSVPVRENPLVLTATGDIELTAVFERVPLSVQLGVNGGGTAEAWILDTSEYFYHGTRVRLTAEADPGWAFSEWWGDVTGSLNPSDFVLTADVEATAVFARIAYDVDVSTEGAGTVAKTYDGEVAGFTRLRLVASPRPGWRFVGWWGDVSGPDADTFVVLDADKNVGATFTPIVYDLHYDITGSGTIEPMGGNAILGAELALYPRPSRGWSFAHWGNDPADTTVPKMVTIAGDTAVKATFVENTWTILVYMSGDNELEPNMLDDINELEAVDVAPYGINILVLADRADGHSTADGNWTGTRLYQIRHDPAGVNGTIVSGRMSSEELGLTDSGDNEELNLGSGATLAAFLEHANRRFAADHTALVVWGHGGGYRSGAGYPEVRPASGTKALSLDATSGGDTLLTPELGDAVAGRGISILALDACYGAMVEIAYEVRDDAEYFIASQDVVSTDGWEYDRFLSSFVAGGLGTDEFATAAVDHFGEAYATVQRATISAVALAKVDGVYAALNALASAVSAEISSEHERATLRGGIFDEVVGFYETPGDLAVDLGALASHLAGQLPEAAAEGSALADAVSRAVYRKHDNGHPNTSGLSVHYVPVDGEGFPLRHDPAYMRGAQVGTALEFVESSSWVPDEADEAGLLYRLWYEVFE